MPCLGGATCLETPFPLIPLGFFFPGNMEAVPNEHNEGSIRIYHEWEKRYSGKWNPNMFS